MLTLVPTMETYEDQWTQILNRVLYFIQLRYVGEMVHLRRARTRALDQLSSASHSYKEPSAANTVVANGTSLYPNPAFDLEAACNSAAI